MSLVDRFSWYASRHAMILDEQMSFMTGTLYSFLAHRDDPPVTGRAYAYNHGMPYMSNGTARAQRELSARRNWKAGRARVFKSPFHQQMHYTLKRCARRTT